MTDPLRVLLLEDWPADAELIVRELRRFGYVPQWQRVASEEEFLAALDPALDLILADHVLPQVDALTALNHVRRRGLDVPFLIVSGCITEEVAVEAMRRGACDYLFKDRLARLGPAVSHALQQRQLRSSAEQRLRASEQRFRALIEHSSDGITLFDADAVILYASPAVRRILGYDPAEVVGHDSFELTHPNDEPALREAWAEVLLTPGGSRTMTFRARHKDGSWRWVERILTNLLADPSVGAIISNYRDVSERKLLQEHENELRLARRIQQSLLPAAMPLLPGFEVGGAFRPAAATGGDYFDFMPLGEGSLGLVIADVCGHGLASALLMARTQAYLRALGVDYREGGRRRGDSLGRAVSELNAALANEQTDGFFVTLMLGRLDAEAAQLTYVGAGHPAGYVLDAAGRPREELGSCGPPLGIAADSAFPTSAPVALSPGGLLVFLTDGILEARAPDGELFGSRRALDLVRVYRHDPAQRIVENLYQAVRVFSHEAPQKDDMTVIVVKSQA